MTKYKGNIILDKTTCVRKTAKNQIEIPTLRKTYILIETDLKKYSAPPQPVQGSFKGKAMSEKQEKAKDFRNPSIDEWNAAIEKVVK